MLDQLVLCAGLVIEISFILVCHSSGAEKVWRVGAVCVVSYIYPAAYYPEGYTNRAALMHRAVLFHMFIPFLTQSVDTHRKPLLCQADLCSGAPPSLSPQYRRRTNDKGNSKGNNKENIYSEQREGTQGQA